MIGMICISLIMRFSLEYNIWTAHLWYIAGLIWAHYWNLHVKICSLALQNSNHNLQFIPVKFQTDSVLFYWCWILGFKNKLSCWLDNNICTLPTLITLGLIRYLKCFYSIDSNMLDWFYGNNKDCFIILALYIKQI